MLSTLGGAAMSTRRNHLEEHHDHLEWRLQGRLTALTLFLGAGAYAASHLTADPFPSILFAAAYTAGLWHPVQETLAKLRVAQLDIDFLMILVAAGAWLLGHPGEGAALLVLFNAGHTMEEYARARTHSALGELLADLPETVIRLAPDGTRESVAPELLRAGDRIIVRPGERVPVDSHHQRGTSSYDCSSLTGESRPIVAKEGLEIPSGALNQEGLVELEVLRPASESAWQKVIRLIENAPARQSPAQVLSERAGRIFTVAILAVSAVAFLIWWLALGLGFETAAYRAMVLLVAGSPCAIVLSLPSAILAGIASGARRGILFNGGAGLCNLGDVSSVAFDKTGTLSTGEPGVVRMLESNATAEDRQVALALARASTHPASAAVRRHLVDDATSVELVNDIREVPGWGMVGRYAGSVVTLGRGDTPSTADPASNDALGRVVYTRDGAVRITFLLNETARPGAASCVRALQSENVHCLILSGDTQSAVTRMAESVGILDARGELRPEEKWAAIQALRRDRGVAMVGDGINDVPALSAATVGVAMGIRGSAAALSQADVVLVKDRLEDLVVARRISKLTRAIIAQNLTIAIVAAAVMVAFSLAGSLPLVLGVFGHEGGTVLVVLNSLRLLAVGRTDDGGSWESRALREATAGA
jgi:Cd2+/Zn2+-exporting ATPase